MRDTNANRIVTVFGGTGFVGRRIVKHLREHDFLVRIASRHPDRARVLFGEAEPRLQPMMVDIHDDASVAAAIADGYGVVNAVSLYVERGTETFQSVHVEAAARIARHAGGSGVRRLVHISGIGADSEARSPYVWHALAFFADLLPNPPFTRNQVELMQTDNVASSQMPGFGDLSISPSAVEDFIRHLVGAT
jgi:nucleoside-diphosphate-sugar epimerase